MFLTNSYRYSAGLDLYSKCSYLDLDGVNDLVSCTNTAELVYIRNTGVWSFSNYFVPEAGENTNIGGIWRNFGFRAFRLITLTQGDGTFKLRFDISDDGTNTTQTLLTTSTFTEGNLKFIELSVDLPSTDIKLFVDGVEYTFDIALTVTSMSYSNQRLDLFGYSAFSIHHPSEFYYFNLYSDYKTETNYSVLNSAPIINDTNLAMRFDVNTIVWDGVNYDSLDGLMTTENVAEISKIDC